MEGRGLGEGAWEGSGAQLLRERAWQRGPRTSDVRYGPIAASCVLNLKVKVGAKAHIHQGAAHVARREPVSASNSHRKGKFEGNSIDWDYGFTYDDRFKPSRKLQNTQQINRI